MLLKLVRHSVIFRKFPQKCAPSVDRFKPIRERLQKNKKVKANAQGYSHLPTHLMVPTYRSNTNLFKKISLGTQIFIFCQIWLIENSTMSSKQILIGQLWTQEGANIQKITQWHTIWKSIKNWDANRCQIFCAILFDLFFCVTSSVSHRNHTRFVILSKEKLCLVISKV